MKRAEVLEAIAYRFGKVKMQHCRFGVFTRARGWYQCSRVPVRWFMGYGFCDQHAKIVGDALEKRVRV